jgi:hypothetical protein
MNIRSRMDRRRRQRRVVFPFHDSSGTVVIEDRRSNPDRRLGDIGSELQHVGHVPGQWKNTGYS